MRATPRTPDDITDPQERRVATILKEFDEARAARSKLDMKWWVCWEQYRGNSSVFFDESGQRWSTDGSPVYRVNLPKKHWRGRPINKIARTVDLVVAKQMKSRPTFSAKPAQISDASDRLASRGARDLVRHLWLVNKLTARRRALFNDRVNTGNSFVKVFWSETSPPFEDAFSPCPRCAGAGQMPDESIMLALQQEALAGNPDIPIEDIAMQSMRPCQECGGAGQVKTGRRPMGEVTSQIVPPWQIWPIGDATCVEEGIFHGYRLTKEEALRRYGQLGVKPEDLQNSKTMREGESEFAQWARTRRQWRDDDDTRVWVLERWMPPAPGTESPRVTILVGKKIVWDKPTPEPFGRIPIFHFRYRPGSSEDFWADGLTAAIIGSQDFINRTRDNFQRHMLSMAVVKWLVERASVDKDAITNAVGEIVEYTGVNPPQQRSPSPLPEFYVRLLEMENDEIPAQAGLQDIDQGQAPPNIEAFQALHFLAEQSETVHGPLMLEDQEVWREMAQTMLICAVNRYVEGQKRLTQVAGQGSLLEIDALLKADVTNHFTVTCEIGTALAHSPALRAELVMQAFNNGLIDAATANRLLEWGTMLGEDQDDHRLQESVAIQEREAILSGQHMVLQNVHDHAVHMRCHREAALEAQLAGDLQTAMMFEQAAAAHAMAMAPPAPMPGAPTAGAPMMDPMAAPMGAPPDAAMPPAMDNAQPVQ